MDNERSTWKKGNESTDVDPELWRELPETLLESVIAKLPFARVVAFRTVSKKWNQEIIPRAVVHLEASSRSTLLYFGCDGEESKDSRGCAWWLQLYDGQNECGSVQKFQSKSFPAPRCNEDVRLLASEQGLLFFGFICRETYLARDIVVCNPLLSESKSLGLPCPVRVPSEWRGWYAHLVVGVTFDFEEKSYQFVYAGVDSWGTYVTYMYDSLTSDWYIGSFLSALREAPDGLLDVYATSQRSFCCNGNLYWIVMTSWKNNSVQENLLKFDTQLVAWSLIPNPTVECDFKDFNDTRAVPSFGNIHAAPSKGEIFIWHFHRDPLLCKDTCPELLSCEGLFDRNNVRPPQYIDWPCRSDGNVELAPDIKLMQHHVMEKIYRFLGKIHLGSNVTHYRYNAFSQRNFIYHVVVMKLGLVVLVHDTSENSFTTLPLVPKEKFPDKSHRHAKNLWSFSASLTWLP